MLLFYEKNQTENAIFLNPFSVCSSCKLKFVACLFVDKETNESYPFPKKRSKRTCPSMVLGLNPHREGGNSTSKRP